VLDSPRSHFLELMVDTTKRRRNRTGKSYLIPDLQYFATLGREVYFCFDHDQSGNIRACHKRENWVFIHAIRLCSSICLPGPERALMISSCLVGLKHLMRFTRQHNCCQTGKLEASQLTYPSALQVNRLSGEIYSR